MPTLRYSAVLKNPFQGNLKLSNIARMGGVTLRKTTEYYYKRNVEMTPQMWTHLGRRIHDISPDIKFWDALELIEMIGTRHSNSFVIESLCESVKNQSNQMAPKHVLQWFRLLNDFNINVASSRPSVYSTIARLLPSMYAEEIVAIVQILAFYQARDQELLKTIITAIGSNISIFRCNDCIQVCGCMASLGCTEYFIYERLFEQAHKEISMMTKQEVFDTIRESKSSAFGWEVIEAALKASAGLVNLASVADLREYSEPMAVYFFLKSSGLLTTRTLSTYLAWIEEDRTINNTLFYIPNEHDVANIVNDCFMRGFEPQEIYRVIQKLKGKLGFSVKYNYSRGRAYIFRADLLAEREETIESSPPSYTRQIKKRSISFKNQVTRWTQFPSPWYYSR
jgi:hypothetical protein